MSLTLISLVDHVWLSSRMLTKRQRIERGLGATIKGEGLPRWLSSKESACLCKRRRRGEFSPWVRKLPLRTAWQHTPVFLPGEFHRQTMGSQRVKHDWETNIFFLTHTEAPKFPIFGYSLLLITIKILFTGKFLTKPFIQPITNFLCVWTF